MLKKILQKLRPDSEKEMSFLDHLEELRWHLVRSALAILVFAIAAFIFKDIIFDGILLAPKRVDFVTARLMCQLGKHLNVGGLCINQQSFELINTDIAGQFTSHMYVSIIAGIIIAFPYILWELWSFVKPALHINELKYTRGIIFFTTFLFLCGILFGYYIITPLSLNFLGSYQVSPEVQNRISLDSYMGIVTNISLAGGITFELPIVVYFLTKIGLVGPDFLRKYRKHSVVVMFILAAIITPSTDVTSQVLVALPLILLYEVGIWVSISVSRNNKEIKMKN
jgi:sec-independent protein translocase protein TatC